MYDNVCKFMAENFPEDFSNWLIGKAVTMTELKPRELSLEPIRADSVIFLQADDLILRIEFQTDTDEDIPFRMADYRLRLYRKFPQKEVYQVVIYLRKNSSELVRQNTFNLRNLSYKFNVIRLWEEPTEKFLTYPGLYPFAALSRTESSADVLQQIARVIEQIPNRQQQGNVAATTAILAGLVLNQELIKRILRREIMRESVVYQEILAEGEQIGIEKIALNLLREGMSVEQVSRVTELSIERVKELQNTTTPSN